LKFYSEKSDGKKQSGKKNVGVYAGILLKWKYFVKLCTGFKVTSLPIL